MKLNADILQNTKAFCDALSSALHVHNIAVTGVVDYKTKSDDRAWYKEARKYHMDRARAYRAAITDGDYKPRHRTVYGYIKNGLKYVTENYNIAWSDGDGRVAEFKEFSKERFAWEAKA